MLDPLLREFRRKLLSNDNLRKLVDLFQGCDPEFERAEVEKREMAYEILSLRSAIETHENLNRVHSDMIERMSEVKDELEARLDVLEKRLDDVWDVLDKTGWHDEDDIQHVLTLHRYDLPTYYRTLAQAIRKALDIVNPPLDEKDIPG